MTPETTRRVRAVLLILMLLAGLRLALIYRSRHEQPRIPQTQPTRLNADDYVVPRRIHAYDLASLRELSGKPVWIRGGYQITYYPYNPGSRHVDFGHEAGVLGPIEWIEVEDVIQQPLPESMQWKRIPNLNVRIHVGGQELLAVFKKNERNYAFPIGQKNASNYNIFADEVLYYQDPHQLYQHWPGEVWDAIERHEARPGMNELQVQFAIGVGTLESYDGSERVLHYVNGGKQLRVTFLDGKAQKVEGAS